MNDRNIRDAICFRNLKSAVLIAGPGDDGEVAAASEPRRQAADTFQLVCYKYSEIVLLAVVVALNALTSAANQQTYSMFIREIPTYIQFRLNFDGPLSRTAKN